MSTSLERYLRMLIAMLIVTVALSTAIPFLIFPETAEAQEAPNEESSSEPSESPMRAMIEPGDSLWSIAQERLGPNATSDEIGNEVGRIFELNRDRIGGNPNVILLGQELLMPPASEPAEPEPAEPEASGPAEPEWASPEQINEPSALPNLPELPAGNAVSTAKSVVPSGSQNPQYDGRRLLGTVIFVLSIALGILTAFLVALNLLPNLRRVSTRLLVRRSVRETERYYSWNYVLTGGPHDKAELAGEFEGPRRPFEEQNRRPTAAEGEKQESPRKLRAARPLWAPPLQALSASEPDPERSEDTPEEKRSFQVVSILGQHRERLEDAPEDKRALGGSR